ncbi:FAD-dependent oxidoreductase [Paenibacillus sp. J5C_2022]|uniref:FAD-dependent oxidoreductase n=1 Tax=Paenibacillus sp. J5C2022 TaxID=2977129 RepID=UPI0021D193F1|nr:FAD-dependent oxidoreductase [Paenibacillus sp. J5C2022]MCU6711589.1 FAD-dependent oxidoreductase [Paenibacillus sp. J5C2022]
MGYRTVEESYDVVVCGGGLAGFCAAVAAARGGGSVCLVQDRPVFGGTSSSEIRVPPQGAASFHAYARETGIISELLTEERARNHEPPGFDNGYINSVWDMALYDVAVSTPGLHFHLNASITDVAMRDEATIEAITARVSHAETLLTIRGRTFIDCTGDGVVAALAGCEWRMGTESHAEFGEPHAPPEASDDTMGNSIHFKAKDVGIPVPFKAPDWAVRYDDPDFFYAKGRWPGTPRNGYWWIELSVPWHTIYDNETLRHELTRHVLGIWDWIKNRDPRLKEEASTYALDWIGQVPGKRESRRIMGEYLMTEHDPLQKTVFPDEVAYGGWFVDLHEPGGLLADFSEKAALEHGKDSSFMARSYVGPYGIPLRMLIAKGMNNLMMAGRNVSVTHAALGTVRVMGTTALMGQAAGTAAAVALQEKMEVREVPERCIRDVQQRLLRDGCFLPNVMADDPLDIARKAAITASSCSAMSGGEPAADSPIWEAELLKQRRGQWIAIGEEGVIDELEIYLTNETSVEQSVEAGLFAVQHLWDYRVDPGKPLAEARLAVPSGHNGWIRWPVGLREPALAGSYVRLDLAACPEVHWRIASAVEPGHVSAYEIGNGLMRRYGIGEMMGFRIRPSQKCYGAEHVNNGVTRPYKYTNLWRSDPREPLPQHIQLTWRKPLRLKRVELTMPGSLLRDYRQYPELYRDPQCPKDISVQANQDGEWREVGRIANNYQRKRAVVLDEAVETDALRIVVLATNGDPSAALYEVRCYDEEEELPC